VAIDFGCHSAKLEDMISKSNSGSKTFACGLSLAWTLLISVPAWTASLTAEQIMEKNYKAARFQREHQASTMELINANGDKRVRKSRGVSKTKPGSDDQKVIFVFDSPADIKGTAVLIDEDRTEGDKVWVYLPALKKERRLPGSGKKESYVGSDFNYGDIVLPRVSEFRHELVGQEPCPDDAKIQCHVVESRPATLAILEERGVSHMKSWIRSDCFITVRVDQLDESGRPWKHFEGRDVRPVDAARKQWAPFEMEIKNVQNSHRTRLLIEKIDTESPVSDSILNSNQLSRGL
jgi:hypothetical protein